MLLFLVISAIQLSGAQHPAEVTEVPVNKAEHEQILELADTHLYLLRNTPSALTLRWVCPGHKHIHVWHCAVSRTVTCFLGGD